MIDERRETQVAAISHEMIRVYKELFGRGPKSTKTYWVTPNTIVVILEETLTAAERTLVTMGEDQRLRDLRALFQYANVQEFCGPIERITGRRVRAFVSGMDTAVDGLATETFLLHPEGCDAPSRIASSAVL